MNLFFSVVMEMCVRCNEAKNLIVIFCVCSQREMKIIEKPERTKNGSKGTNPRGIVLKQ